MLGYANLLACAALVVGVVSGCSAGGTEIAAEIPSTTATTSPPIKTVNEDGELVEPLPTGAPGCSVAASRSTIESGAPTLKDHAYVVERADAYVGIVVPHMATEQVIDGFEHFGTFVGTGHGGIFTYQRCVGGSLEFLGLVIDHEHGEVTTDAMQLTTNGDDVSLAASCPAKALALYAGSLAGSGYPNVSGALQHWTVNHDGRFTTAN